MSNKLFNDAVTGAGYNASSFLMIVNNDLERMGRRDRGVINGTD
jgi:hypothetical protein